MRGRKFSMCVCLLSLATVFATTVEARVISASIPNTTAPNFDADGNADGTNVSAQTKVFINTRFRAGHVVVRARVSNASRRPIVLRDNANGQIVPTPLGDVSLSKVLVTVSPRGSFTFIGRVRLV